MPAPLGNKNGQATWFKSANLEERQAQIGAKISLSTRRQIEKLLDPGESVSDFLRKAIACELTRRKVQVNKRSIKDEF
ncbi:MAG: hypothetical protein AB4063_18435 [Crocosphaera sp.]